VQVVNFVAQASIEEGMLSVLAFKQSLFAGVLDGGSSEVFMHGSRLSKFMESVEKATQAGAAAPVQEEDAEAEAGLQPMSQPMPETPAAAAETTDSEVATAATAAPANPWAPLLEVGLQLLGGLSGLSGASGQSPLVETDPQSGRAYLKIPVPEPATVQRLADALRDLLVARQ
jgi:hypothetical protein